MLRITTPAWFNAIEVITISLLSNSTCSIFWMIIMIQKEWPRDFHLSFPILMVLTSWFKEVGWICCHLLYIYMHYSSYEDITQLQDEQNSFLVLSMLLEPMWDMLRPKLHLLLKFHNPPFRWVHNHSIQNLSNHPLFIFIYLTSMCSYSDKDHSSLWRWVRGTFTELKYDIIKAISKV